MIQSLVVAAEVEPKYADNKSKFLAVLDVILTKDAPTDFQEHRRKYWIERIENGPGPIYIATYRAVHVGYLAIIDEASANYQILPCYEGYGVLDTLLAKAGVEMVGSTPSPTQELVPGLSV